MDMHNMHRNKLARGGALPMANTLGNTQPWLRGEKSHSYILTSGLVRMATVCLLTAVGLYLSSGNKPGDYESFYAMHGIESFTSGGNWMQLSSVAPVGMQEGSGVRVQYVRDGSPHDEIWFAGGYPTDKGRVLVFDAETHEWTLPPEKQLLWPLHHCLNSMIYDEKNCRIVLLGGIRIFNGQQQANHAVLTLDLCDSGGTTWEEHPLEVGGIISCSSIPLEGKYWCYSGSNEYVEESFKFFSFDLESLSIEFFPGPKYESTHVSILVDEMKGIIYLSGGRDKHHYPVGKIVSFDLKTKSWTREEIAIPFVQVEDRGYIQLPGRKALLLGGQSTGDMRVVTDIILEFDFDTRAITLVDESPMPLFGEQLVDMKNGSYFVFSGASGTGPKYSRSAWMYHPGKKKVAKITSLGEPTIIDGTCGSTPVTMALKMHLQEIMKVINHSDPIYVRASWCKDGLGPGNHDILHVLTITFLRDGVLRRVQCEDYNACLLRS